MAFEFGARSRQRMEGLHPDLIAVMELALSRSPIDFTVVEGLRSKSRQAEMVRSGASQTMNSRHLTGHAIDIAPYVGNQVRWDWPLYHQIAPVIKQAAKDLGVPLDWGGDWSTFKDGPHWELSWGEYPSNDMTPRVRQAPQADWIGPGGLDSKIPDSAFDKVDGPVPWAKFRDALMRLLRAIFGGSKK